MSDPVTSRPAAGSLVLEIAGKTWTLQSGDIIGRFGTVAGTALTQYDMLSRRHMQVDKMASIWHLTLLPSARNPTRLDGVLMPASEPMPLGSVNHVTVENLHLQFRQIVEAAAGIPAPPPYPVATVSLDPDLTIVAFNERARALLGPLLDHGNHFLEVFAEAEISSLRATLRDLPKGQAASELHAFTKHDIDRRVGLYFLRDESGYHGALRDSTADGQLYDVTRASEQRLLKQATLLAALMKQPAFHDGDLPGALPALEQTASQLLKGITVSVWTRLRKDKLMSVGADADNGARFVIGYDVPSDAGNLSKDAYLHACEVGLTESYAGEAMVIPSPEALIVLERAAKSGWSAAEKQTAENLDVVLQQLSLNATYAKARKKFEEHEAEVNAELAAASGYISRLLPAPISKSPVRVEWAHKPCGTLAGDVFGYEWISEHQMVLFILDAAGHGAPAALFAVSAVNTLKLWIAAREKWLTSPDIWLQKLNEAFPMEKHSGISCTMWCGIYNRKTSQITYASAGHPPAILLHNGQMDALSTGGPVLGIMPEMKYKAASATIPAGAKLYLYTDGVYEFPGADGQTGSPVDFANAVRVSGGMAEGECAFLLQRALALTGGSEFSDDFTIVRFLFDN